MPEDIERIFKDDIKNKTVIARSSGKKGVSTIRDYLSHDQIKQLNGVVQVSSIYDKVISYSDFKALNRDTKIKYLKNYLERFSRVELAKIWGISKQNLHDFVSRYGLSQPRGANKKQKVEVRQQNKPVVKAEVSQELVPQLPKISKPILRFNMTIVNTLPGFEIKKRLHNVMAALSDEYNYNISLELNELDQKVEVPPPQDEVSVLKERIEQLENFQKEIGGS